MNPLAKLLLMVPIMLMVNDVRAQGVVLFRNDLLTGPPLGPDRHVRDVDGTPLSGTNFIAQLLYQDRSGTWVAHPGIARFSTSAANAGFWSGSSRTLVNAGSPVPYQDEPVNLQVRVWDAGFGGPLTFDEAVAAGMRWGNSTVFVYHEEWDFPRGPDDTYMKNFEGFTLVPEPSIWALVTLGAGGLLWRYRRSKFRP
ncbi:MAG TPA: PEP-CTERM sorting domain-containing protein [Candidatus Binatia bacterium]|nr:PEP-CTERM sorting domain-containing protein [Candidatus Binatia bacterium]